MGIAQEISISPVISERIPGLILGVLEADQISVTSNPSEIEPYFADLFHFIKNKFTTKRPSEDEVVSAVRRMYRRIGWEPTRYRPSSEAMIRRILKDRGLYHINNAVDLGNIASARFHIPMGLYDRNKINPPVLCDVGHPGESYQGLSIDLIHAEGKMILRDQVGVFGNPTADSKRTCIRTTSKNIVAIFFGPPEVKKNHIQETLDFLEDLYRSFFRQMHSKISIVSC